MKLVDLQPRWVGAGGDGVTRNGDPVPERHGVGISFECPCGCPDRVAVLFANPLDGGPPYVPERSQWHRAGETFENLTLAPSILRVGGCAWHGFIEAGNIRTC